MSKLFRKANKDEAEINITPMMDVVFIMLIFFIVTSTFVKENGIGISRASATDQNDNDAPVATIKLDALGHSINDQSVALDGMKSRLSQLKAANPNLKAQLFAAKNIDIATLVRAVEQAKEVDIANLSVSTF